MQQSRTDGFTLIELMVTAGLLLMLVAGVTGVFTSQQHAHVVVDQVTAAQQSVRAAAQLIARDIRRAGYMVPGHAAACAFDQITGPDTLFVSDADAIRSVFDLEADDEDLRGHFGAPITGESTGATLTGAARAISLQRLWVDVQADGDDFEKDRGVIVVDRARPDAPAACGQISSIAGNTLTVDFGDSSHNVGSNADLVAVPAHVYRLEPVPAGGGDRLLRDEQLLSSGVEDFQLTFFIDEDDDRVLDAGELYSDAGTTAAPWEMPASNRPDFSLLREIGVHLVTVTRDDDPRPEFQQGSGQIRGNRDAASLPVTDGKRRRTSSSRVRLRNMG